jgi:hypothetical protein
LAAHLHILPMLKTSGAIHLRPIYAFMAWTGRTLPLLIGVTYVCMCLCPYVFIIYSIILLQHFKYHIYVTLNLVRLNSYERRIRPHMEESGRSLF